MAIVPDHVMTHVRATAPDAVIAEVINLEANSNITIFEFAFYSLH